MAHPSLWPATSSLWQREVVRFLRQRSRVVGALATPIVFWILIGSGIGRSFQAAGMPENQGYLEYFFPGTLVAIVLFTSIFSMISVIEDRREGFMQGVLIAPVGSASILWGKVLGSSTLAVGQAALFLPAAWIIGIDLTAVGLAATLASLVLVSFKLSALGLLIAWPMDSSQGFHAIMNLVLIPMWFLSGALFPPQGASAWIAYAMSANPLTYGVAAIRRTLALGNATEMTGLPSLPLSLGVTLGTTVVLIIIASRLMKRRS